MATILTPIPPYNELAALAHEIARGINRPDDDTDAQILAVAWYADIQAYAAAGDAHDAPLDPSAYCLEIDDDALIMSPDVVSGRVFGANHPAIRARYQDTVRAFWAAGRQMAFRYY